MQFRFYTFFFSVESTLSNAVLTEITNKVHISPFLSNAQRMILHTWTPSDIPKNQNLNSGSALTKSCKLAIPSRKKKKGK